MSLIHIDKTNFEAEVRQNEKRVLLDFYAEWCGPCLMLSPIIEAIAEEHPEYIIGKINVDEQPELAAEFNVMNIPALFVLENGQVVNRTQGTQTKNQILKMLQS